jgi:hypothetical protein
MHQPLVVVPHGGLLIPGDIPRSDWPREVQEHDRYADWVYDLNGLVPDVSVFKFPYSPAVVDVDREREKHSSEATDHYDYFYSAITEVGCSYALIGHTSRPGRVDGKGNKFSAHAVVLDGEQFKGMYLSSAPREHAVAFAGSLVKAMPLWRVELNTTYRDEYSALRRNFKAMCIPTLTLVVDETLYVTDGKVDMVGLNLVRRAIAGAFNAVLTEFPA